MRYLILTAAALCVAGCAGQPSKEPVEGQKLAAADTTSAAATEASKPKKRSDARPKVIPERVKGPYKMVMKGDKKLFCTKELATGSHVNYRTICLTPEEYADLERQADEWRDGLSSQPNYGAFPRGLGPGENPLMPGVQPGTGP